MVCYCNCQFGHMRTNKNCPKYGADPETQLDMADPEKAFGRSNALDPSGQPQQKNLKKKLIPKSATKLAVVEAPDDETLSTKAKGVPVKFKCGSTSKPSDTLALAPIQGSEEPATSDVPIVNKSTNTSRVIVPNKLKLVEPQFESPRPSIVIRPPTDGDRSQVESHKPSIVIRPPASADREQVEFHKPHIVIRPPANAVREQVGLHKPSIVIRPPTDREQQKKIVIKRPKEVIDYDSISQEPTTPVEFRKTKKIAELSSFENRGKQEKFQLGNESIKRKATEGKRFWEEEEKRRNIERAREEKARKLHKEEMRVIEERERFAELRRYEESIRREREEEERQKAKKKKKKKPEIVDEYLDDYRARRTDRRIPERDRGTSRKRPAVELGKYGADYTPATKRRRGGEVPPLTVPYLYISFLFLQMNF